jgi:hypothetical protein
LTHTLNFNCSQADANKYLSVMSAPFLVATRVI